MSWHFFFKHPVICIDVSPDNVLFAGLVTGEVVAVKMGTNDQVRLGSH